MKKLFLILTFIFSIPPVYALDSYTCSNEFKAHDCRDCIQNVDSKFYFKVNVQNQVVIRKNVWAANEKIKKPVTTSTYLFEGCKVADEYNWVCQTYWENGHMFYNKTMSDGIFSDIQYNIFGKVYASYCAK